MTQKTTARHYLSAAVIMMLAIFALAYIAYVNPDLFENVIRQYGALGIFIAAIIANATILLPLPIDIFIFILSSENFFGFGIFDPLLLGILVGVGSAIGEMSGYIIGMLGIKSIESMRKEEIKKIDEIKHKIHELGAVFIALGAFTPFPFDIIGLAAGMIKYDPEVFFVAAAIGKIARYIVIAYAGMFSITAVKLFFGF